MVTLVQRYVRDALLNLQIVKGAMNSLRKSRSKRPKRPASTSENSGSEEKSTPAKRTKRAPQSTGNITHAIHEFSAEDGKEFTSSLVTWYNINKRSLPWRSLSTDLSPTDRAYAVLVSEVMLQQTQVVTVIPYYTKWMSRWPTFSHLAKASLNDVNEVWAGMGYYSRAKRLWEAAKKVDGELNNEVPLQSAALQEQLPGVGRYTAGAVASIAFGEKVAAVDGNVVRVLSRARCIGADHTSKLVLDHIWRLSEQLVPDAEPGNYNQAMMDLGATICTPKKPSCKTCPVSHVCFAYQRVQQTNPLKELQVVPKPVIEDIENVPCELCLKQPWDADLGVMNFPQKAKKAPPRNEVTLVCIIHVCIDGTDEYLLIKRPQGGLLAGLWEFPNFVFGANRDTDDVKETKELETDLLRGQWGVSPGSKAQFVAEVPHIFSHIHQLYVVYSLKLPNINDTINKKKQESKWMKSDEILSSAISTAMKKVFKAFTSSQKKDPETLTKGRSKSKKAKDDTTSRKLSDFFKKVEK